VTEPRRAATRSDAAVVAYLGFIGALLAFGIDTALPAFDEIRDEYTLADGSGEVSLVVTAYFLGMAAGQLPIGPLSDRFGRRPVLLSSLALYVIGAVGATLAPSFGGVLVARFVWGLGASGPAVVSHAIARDLYEGDRMARVLSLVMAVFLIGPTIAPLIGEGLLAIFPWQSVFAGAALLAVLGISWTLRFGETLPPERRRPIEPRAIGRAIRTTLTHRASTGYLGAMVFSYAAFFVFLGSSQPIVDEVYDRAEWFAITFGVISAVNGVCVYLVSRRVERLGAARVAQAAYFTSLMGYALMTVAALAADGVPAFLLWGALVTVTGTSSTIVTTTAISLALQPMERIAGTASAVRGVGTLGIGSVLASLIDRRIDDTITPMAVGGLVYCAIGFAILSYARGGALDIVDPDAPRQATH
jgi:DHA1 family bicyclomycin/chloramphenicol resistance-like MFS transporter